MPDMNEAWGGETFGAEFRVREQRWSAHTCPGCSASPGNARDASRTNSSVLAIP
jgi:hypothetical protein